MKKPYFKNMKKPEKLSVKVRIIIEAEVEVFGDYTPAVQEVRYLSNGDAGNPGESESFDIINVWWNDTNITNILDANDFDYTELEQDCLNKLNK